MFALYLRNENAIEEKNEFSFCIFDGLHFGTFKYWHHLSFWKMINFFLWVLFCEVGQKILKKGWVKEKKLLEMMEVARRKGFSISLIWRRKQKKIGEKREYESSSVHEEEYLPFVNCWRIIKISQFFTKSEEAQTVRKTLRFLTNL